MKRIGFYVTALLAGLWTSCSNVEDVVSPVENEEQFVAVIAEGETRTSIGGNSVLWTYNADKDKTDAISIFRKNGYNTKYILSGLDENVATFKYSGIYTGASSSVELTNKKNYAVYPYDGNITIATDGAVTVMIPAGQNYTTITTGTGENVVVTPTFDPKAAFMFAAVEQQTLNFKNANALMKFEFIKMPGDADYTVNSIKLTSANKALSGSAKISMTNDGPTVTLANKTTTNNSLTLTTNAVVKSMDVNNPAVFYLVVTPGTYAANDLTLTFNVTYGGDTKVIEKTITEEVTIGRNSINKIPYTLGSEDFTGNIDGFGSTSDNIDVNN